MSQEKQKKNKYENEEKWNEFLQPLTPHLEEMADSTDPDIQDAHSITTMNIRRGTRTPDLRQGIVNQLKIEFAHLEIPSWTVQRLKDAELKVLKKLAAKDRPADKQYFNKTTERLTYRKGGVVFDFRDDNHYCDMREASRFSKLRKAYSEGDLDLQNTNAYFEFEANFEPVKGDSNV